LGDISIRRAVWQEKSQVLPASLERREAALSQARQGKRAVSLVPAILFYNRRMKKLSPYQVTRFCVRGRLKVRNNLLALWPKRGRIFNFGVLLPGVFAGQQPALAVDAAATALERGSTASTWRNARRH